MNAKFRRSQKTAPGALRSTVFVRVENGVKNVEYFRDIKPIPGTSFRFGIDGIIGLVPGLGDVLAGLLSLVIPLAAWIRGVPYVTLLRMVINLGIGVLVGTIPIFGDIFDVAWKTNKRNYRLLTRHLAEPRRHTWRDWAFLLLLAGGIGFVFAIPVLLVVWILAWLLQNSPAV